MIDPSVNGFVRVSVDMDFMAEQLPLEKFQRDK